MATTTAQPAGKSARATTGGVHPVTVEVVRNSLPAAADEMADGLARSSYNMMIYEVRDFSCAILDCEGRLLCQNVGGVSHFVADLGVVITDAVERIGLDGFRPGDGYIMNHQRVCGQHLNNIVAYTPIFTAGQLFGFAVVRAHWVDVGGMSTGFGAAGAGVTDPWVEGLQIDQLRIQRDGAFDAALLKLVMDNVRYPDSAFGDLRAQLAACRAGAQRIEALVERYGIEAVNQSIARLFADSEERCRRIVAAIPNGEYIASSFLDHDMVDKDDPLDIVARVVVAGSDMTIDLTGCARQRRSSINSRTRAAAYVAYKAITAPLEPVNEGSFAALDVVVDEGNFMMAQFPAPMAKWSIAIPTVVDTILAAVAPAMPDRVPAAHHSSLGGGIAFFGTDPHTHRRFVTQTVEGGGWGGRPDRDGQSAAVSVCQGDVRNAPIESLELKYPLLVDRRELRTDSGGAGRHRGGLGITTEIRNLVDGTWSFTLPPREKCPPWGLFGGRSAVAGGIELRDGPDGDHRSIGSGRQNVRAGASARIMSGGGGGWGDPLDRPLDEVDADLLDGFVTTDAGERCYGVVVDRSTGLVDRERTAAARADQGR
ncbi:MAG: hydantoinase B/oxoprolinase family protein [Acidimicrobiales bacterium]